MGGQNGQFEFSGRRQYRRQYACQFLSASGFRLQGDADQHTNFTLFYSPNTYDKFTGSGFNYDLNGYPYSGTISSWVYVESGKTIFSATSLNMPVSEYMSYFYADDWEGLLEAAFDGNDTITGTAGQDDLYGYCRQ